MPDCLFCKIGAGIIPVHAVYEDDACLVFPDIGPQAPTHLLVIPRAHYASVVGVPPQLLGHLLQVAGDVAARELPGGFRIVANTGKDGGQTVPHLHLHVLGGRHMGWPPG